MAYTKNLITIQQQVSNHLLLFHLLSCKNQCKELYLVLPKYGVIPFEIRSLKIGHTEQRRAQRFYKAEIVRHRGTVGAWRNRGYLQVLLMLWSTSLQSSGLQDFLKRLLPKLSATRTLRLCRSLCLRHLREIVCFHLRALPPLCATFICSRLNLSLHISEEQKLLSRICTLYLCRSLCRRHLRDIALPPSLRYSVCLLYKTFSLSLHISEEPDNISKKVRL